MYTELLSKVRAKLTRCMKQQLKYSKGKTSEPHTRTKDNVAQRIEEEIRRTGTSLPSK